MKKNYGLCSSTYPHGLQNTPWDTRSSDKRTFVVEGADWDCTVLAYVAGQQFIKKCLITFLSLFYWSSHVCCFYIKWLIFFCRNGVDALMHSTFKTTSSIIHQLGYQKKVSISFLLLLLVVLYVLYCTHTTANSLTNSCMAALAATLATIVPSFLP